MSDPASSPPSGAQPATAAHTLALHLHLQHQMPLGELAPYFHALAAGRALATRCTVCGRSWFAPRLACPQHGLRTMWHELPGHGRLVAVTQTQTSLPFTDAAAAIHVFALVAMAGADNLCFARLAPAMRSAQPGQTVWISRASGAWPHPAQAAEFVGDVSQRVMLPLAGEVKQP